MRLILIALLAPCFLQAQSHPGQATPQTQARRITIHRDEWGVPHIYGRTDADCVFGLMYAQCEDNWWQVEETTVKDLGRYAELYGEKELERDAAVALYRCVKKAKEEYAKGNFELKRLCDAAAAGVNHYLLTHPTVERRLLQRFEPWFFLLMSGPSGMEHGIANEERKAAFTAAQGDGAVWEAQGSSGSNTIAIAPRKSASGNALLLINPHVAFFGDNQRYEAHLVSEEGWNVSGFAMLGDPFIWSGFTSTTAWAHTNTASDYDDVWAEVFDHPTDSLQYKWGGGYRTATVWADTLRYKTADGLKQKVLRFTATHHGPVMAQRGATKFTARAAADSKAALLLQAYRMSKARNRTEFEKAMSLAALPSNTSYADAQGNIAFWNGNAVPRRDTAFNWMMPVDGSHPKTEWKGLHRYNEVVHSINPQSGWLQNCNSTPYEMAGANSPSPKAYPAYMSYDPPTYRAMEALRLLSRPGKLSFEGLRDIAYSNHSVMMASWVPQLLAAYEREAAKNASLQTTLGAAVDTLRRWNHRSTTGSTATTLAVFWVQALNSVLNKMFPPTVPFYHPSIVPYLHGTDMPFADSTAVQALQRAVAELTKRFGTPFVPWGDVNRLQRVHSSGTLEKFDSTKPSLPVPFIDGRLGALPAHGHRGTDGQRLYGVAGNSYVAIVELGKRVKAKSAVPFGQTADPASPHWFDQAPLYVEGKLKDAWFYKEDVLRAAKRSYQPGEE